MPFLEEPTGDSQLDRWANHGPPITFRGVLWSAAIMAILIVLMAANFSQAQ